MTGTPPLWPLLLYAVLVVILAGLMLLVPYLVGERRRRERATDTPYESGMSPTGSAHIRMPAEFYLIAMFFVIFDLETIFIVAWAVSARALGWAGYIAMLVFIGVLLVTLGYLWRMGALDWNTGRQQAAARGEERRHVDAA